MTKVKQAIDRTPDIVCARAIYKRATEVDTEASTAAYAMATEQLDTMDLKETPLTTPTETEVEIKIPSGKKKPGPQNPDQVAEFVSETTKNFD